MSSPGDVPAGFTLLLVCTGNVCRSALAERLGRAYLDENLGISANAVQLGSAGTRAVVGSAMHPDSALVLRGYGAEPGKFRARQLEERHVREADLVLTMTRDHRRDVLARSPRALSRAFTLREAAALLAQIAPSAAPRGVTTRAGGVAWVEALAAARAHRASGPQDDILDPIGKPLEVHGEVGELIVGALLPILQRVASLFSTEADSDR